MKKLFIALDIDGVLNSTDDNMDIENYLSQNNSNQDSLLINKNGLFLNKYKCAINESGHPDLSSFVNIDKLSLFNKMLYQFKLLNYDITIVIVSSWFPYFKSNWNRSIEENVDIKKELKFFKQFLNIDKTIKIDAIENTIGLAQKRFEQFIHKIKPEVEKSSSNLFLYLDDISLTKYPFDIIDDNVIFNFNEKIEINELIQFNQNWIIPNINGKDGFTVNHANQIINKVFMINN